MFKFQKFSLIIERNKRKNRAQNVFWNIEFLSDRSVNWPNIITALWHFWRKSIIESTAKRIAFTHYGCPKKCTQNRKVMYLSMKFVTKIITTLGSYFSEEPLLSNESFQFKLLPQTDHKCIELQYFERLLLLLTLLLKKIWNFSFDSVSGYPHIKTNAY